MKFDFSKQKDLNKDEVKAFNEYFNQPKILKNLEKLEENRKFNLILSLCVGSFILLGATLSIYANLLFLILVMFLIGLGAYLFLKRKGDVKEGFIGSFLKTILGNKFSYSNSGDLFPDTVRDIYRKTGLLDGFDSVDYTEDSLKYMYTLNKQDSISLRGMQLQTSQTTTDEDGKSSKSVTNRCYIFKLSFLNARFKARESIKIKNDTSDLSGSTFSVIMGAMVFGGMLGIPLFNDTGSFTLAISAGVIGFSAVVYFGLLRHNKRRVRLENYEFEQLFDVYSKDQITSRQVLNASIMEKLVAYVNKTKKTYSIFFQGRDIYVMYPVRSSYLEFSIFKSLHTNLYGFTNFYTEVKNILDFSRSINLMYFDKNYFQRKPEENNKKLKKKQD